MMSKKISVISETDLRFEFSLLENTYRNLHLYNAVERLFVSGMLGMQYQVLSYE